MISLVQAHNIYIGITLVPTIAQLLYLVNLKDLPNNENSAGTPANPMNTYIGMALAPAFAPHLSPQKLKEAILKEISAGIHANLMNTSTGMDHVQAPVLHH